MMDYSFMHIDWRDSLTVKPKPEIDLSTALSSDLMTPLLNNPDVCKVLQPLLPDYAGTDSDKGTELKDTLNSAQFKQVTNYSPFTY